MSPVSVLYVFNIYVNLPHSYDKANLKIFGFSNLSTTSTLIQVSVPQLIHFGIDRYMDTVIIINFLLLIKLPLIQLVGGKSAPEYEMYIYI